MDGFSLSEKKGRDDERGGGASKAGLPFLELNNAAGYMRADAAGRSR